MNAINKAKRFRMAAVEEGEGVKIRTIKEAEAEVHCNNIIERNPLPSFVAPRRHVSR
jgi:hypothetical protein